MGTEKLLFLPLKNGQTKYHKCISTLWQFYRVLRPLRLIYRTESSIASALYASVSHLVCAWIWSCGCVCCVHVQHQRQWYIFSTTTSVVVEWSDKKGNERKYKLPPRDSSMPSRVDVDVIFSLELRFGQRSPARGDTT